MNIEISRSPVRAETRKKSLHQPSLMKCLLPCRRQLPSACGSARVRMPCASEPAPGSVIAIAQVRAPCTAGSSQRATCSPRHSSSGS